MRTKFIQTVLFTFTIVFAAYAADAQIVEKIKDKTVKAAKKTVKVTKDVAGKTKDAVVDGTDKTVEVSKDVAGETKDIAGATKDVTVDAAKNVGSKTRKIGGYTVDVTENVVGSAYEGGRWLTVTAWDGTKLASKRTWFAAKKAAEATKDFVVGDDTKKP